MFDFLKRNKIILKVTNTNYGSFQVKWKLEENLLDFFLCLVKNVTKLSSFQKNTQIVFFMIGWFIALFTVYILQYQLLEQHSIEVSLLDSC